MTENSQSGLQRRAHLAARRSVVNESGVCLDVLQDRSVAVVVVAVAVAVIFAIIIIFFFFFVVVSHTLRQLPFVVVTLDPTLALWQVVGVEGEVCLELMVGFAGLAVPCSLSPSNIDRMTAASAVVAGSLS
jgi:hypothetical protein